LLVSRSPRPPSRLAAAEEVEAEEVGAAVALELAAVELELAALELVAAPAAVAAVGVRAAVVQRFTG
jgi:hypothetical protein